MKFTLCALVVASSLVVSSVSHAARSRRLRDEVASIDVGPDHHDTDDDASGIETDATDYVDKPMTKPRVLSSDAPAAAAPEPAPAPATVKVENAASTSTVETDDDDADAKTPAPIAPAPASTPAVAPALAPSAAPATTAGRKKAPGTHVAEPVAGTTNEPTDEPADEHPVAATAEPAATTSATAPPAAAQAGVSAEQSLKWLENGNTRYVTKKFRGDGRGEKDRAKPAKPHAIVLSCSDSRVPPELIFDQGLGEITTIRVAGEVLDSSVIASIEQAIQQDHPHLLVVLGHTQCPAVEQAMNWKTQATFGSDALDRMVSEIKPHLASNKAPASKDLATEGALQADGVSRDLTDRSAIIKKAVDSKELVIKTGLYWVDTGRVKFY